MKAVIEGIIVGIINTFLVMVLFIIPVLNILVFLFPVPITVVGIRRGTSVAIMSLVISSILMGLFIHPFFAIIMFSLNLLIVLALIYAYKKDYEMSEAIVLSSGATLLSILISLQAFTWMAGESFFDFLWSNLKSFISSNSINLSRLMEIYQTMGMIDKAYSIDQFAEILIGQMKDLALLFPSFLLISSLLLGGSNFFVSRFVLKRLGFTIRKIPPFRRWSLPKGTGRGFLGLMIVAAIGNWLKLPNFEVVLFTVSSVFTFLFTVQGLSVGNFFLREKRVPGIIGVFILLAAFIFFSVALTFLGILEQILGIRRSYVSRDMG